MSSELMAIEAARRLGNDTVCFVGIGLPSAAANLARATHAPDCVLIYESVTIGAKPTELPLSIGQGGRILVMLSQTRHPFVERLDFCTSVGDRIRVVVTDLDDVRAATGWELRVADVRETTPRRGDEVRALRGLRTKGDG